MRDVAEVLVFWPWMLLGAAIRKTAPTQEEFDALPPIARALAYAAGERE